MSDRDACADCPDQYLKFETQNLKKKCVVFFFSRRYLRNRKKVRIKKQTEKIMAAVKNLLSFQFNHGNDNLSTKKSLLQDILKGGAIIR